VKPAANEPAGPQYVREASETVYRGAVVSLRRDRVRMSDGSVADREVLEHPGSVAILALDERGRVVLVNQYRHPIGARLDELPAGLLDVSGEPALACARRELIEEAGLVAGTWHVLLDLYLSPGISDEAIRIFLARDLAPAPDSGFVAEHEELTLTVRRVPLADAVARVADGSISNAPAVAGILAAAAARAGDFAGLRPGDAPFPARPEH
jgi:ADP-ribose pyrophosphatase